MQPTLLPSLGALRLDSYDRPAINMKRAAPVPSEPEHLVAAARHISMPVYASDIDRLFGQIDGAITFQQYIKQHQFEYLGGDLRQRRLDLTAAFTDNTLAFKPAISNADWRHVALEYYEYVSQGEGAGSGRSTRGGGIQVKDEKRERVARMWLLAPHVLWRLCSVPVQQELMDLVHDAKAVTTIREKPDELGWFAYTQALRANRSVQVLGGVNGQNVSGYALLELADAMSTYRQPRDDEDGSAWEHIHDRIALPRKGHALERGGVWSCNFGEYAFQPLSADAQERRPRTVVEKQLAESWSTILPPRQGLPAPTEAAGRALLNLLRSNSNLCFSYVNKGKGATCPPGFATITDMIGYVSTDRLKAWSAHCDEHEIDARLGMMEILRLNRAGDTRWRCDLIGSNRVVILSVQHTTNPFLNPTTLTDQNRRCFPITDTASSSTGGTSRSGRIDPHPPNDERVQAVRARINYATAIATLKRAASQYPPWYEQDERLRIELRACFDLLVKNQADRLQ